MKSNLIDMTFEFLYETDHAILVTDGVKDIWLPKSQIESIPDDKKPDHVIVTMPEWLAKEKELI